MAKTMGTNVGRVAPPSRATHRVPAPLPIPFMATTSAGSQSDMEAVQLFSMPQHRQAPSTRSDPGESDSPAPGCRVSRVHDIVMATMPAQSLGEMCSPKNARAKSAVATISKLLSRDTLSAGVVASPPISRRGAATSSATIAAT